MNNILSLRKDLQGLSGLIHYQSRVSDQDLFCKNLNRVLGLPDNVFHPLNKLIAFILIVEILIIDQVCLPEHLLKDCIVFGGRRYLSHCQYLFVCGFVRNERVEEA
jgi:hypothetical protein